MWHLGSVVNKVLRGRLLCDIQSVIDSWHPGETGRFIVCLVTSPRMGVGVWQLYIGHIYL